MNTLLRLSLFVALIMPGALVAGNYMINRKQGMCSSDSIREAQMWGAGFILYAVFDYLILTL